MVPGKLSLEPAQHFKATAVVQREESKMGRHVLPHDENNKTTYFSATYIHEYCWSVPVAFVGVDEVCLEGLGSWHRL